MDVLALLFRLVRLVVLGLSYVLRWTLWLLIRVGRFVFNRTRTSFGSARWATFGDLLNGDAWGGSTGLIAGKRFGRFLRYHGEGALLVYAPQGSGKGVGVVVPNLLDHPGSVIVTDVKGENAAITARHRATLGPVYQLNAIDPAASACFNPLSMIQIGSSFEAEDIAALADMLVTEESSEGHWDTAAKNLIAMFIGWVVRVMPPEQRTLSTIRELIASDDEHLRELLERMAVCPFPTVAEQARLTLSAIKAESPEMLSVLSNAGKAMVIWSKDRVAGRLTATSDFDMMDLHRNVITVYIMVPENHLKVLAPLLRVMMGCALTALLRAKALPRPQHLPLLLIDECAALERLDALAKGVGYLRAYARLILVFQDLGQLYGIYGEKFGQSFIAASGAQVAFRVSDNRTARELAESIGMKTITTRSSGYSQSNADLIRAQQQAGQGEAGRYLIDPAEIRRMPDHLSIVQMSTVRAPIRACKVRYFTERCWQGLWDVWRAPAPSPSVVVPWPGPAADPARRDAA